MAISTLPSPGPRGGKRRKWLHHPCLLGVPMVVIHQNAQITHQSRDVAIPLTKYTFQGKHICRCAVVGAAMLPPVTGDEKTISVQEHHNQELMKIVDDLQEEIATL